MRPRHLHIEAVGPYAGVTDVHFDDLAGDGLFLIHGRTGSGKTFLLDAISFALFGEVAGSRRHQPLRSDHAAADAEPVVRLDFTLDGTDWRVERSPAHTRAKKRGTGSTERPSTAALHRRQNGDWVAVESGTRPVTLEIQRLLGLDVSQFSQVVLLPQGQVERVLRAGSDEREALLETLFGTSAYEVVAQKLHAAATERTKRLEEAVRRTEDRRRQATELWLEVFSGGDGVAGIDVSPDEQSLDDLAGSAEKATERLTTHLSSADAVRRATQHRVTTCSALADRWSRRERLGQQMHELDDRSDGIDELRGYLAAAEAARTFAPQLRAAATARAEVADALAELEQARVTLQEAATPLGTLRPSALQDLIDGNGTPGSALQAASELAAALRAQLMLVAQHRAATAKRADVRRAQRTATASEAEALDALHRLTDRVEELDEQILLAKHAAERREDLVVAARAARERATRHAELVRVRSMLPALADAVAVSTTTLRAAQEHENAVLRRYVDGLASTLAVRLVPGDPCGVCGSITHPSPASVGVDHIDIDVVDAARSATESARAELASAATAHDETQRKVDILEAMITTPEIGDDLQMLDADVERTQEALAIAESLARDLPLLETERGETAERRDDADNRATAAHATLLAAEHQIAAIGGQLDELDRALADIDPDCVEAAASGLPGAIEAIRLLAEAEAVHAEAGQRASDAGRALEICVTSSVFSTEAEATAALIAGDRGDLRAQIEAFDRERHAVRAALMATDLEGLPEDRPDVAAAQRAHEAADATARAAASALDRAIAARDKLRARAAHERDDQRALTALRVEADAAHALAATCRGDNPARVSLQRWVLGTYLEHICVLANQRLCDMTAGRYTLVAHRDRERGGARSGLGLRVLDAHTGIERDVSSLSGGETFQAALALALGIADAVTSATGGVRLDALFIDEGFGSLDPDALDQAMVELSRLRDGDRLVGVISHVASLRDQIPIGVEVVATSAGSTVRAG